MSVGGIIWFWMSCFAMDWGFSLECKVRLGNKILYFFNLWGKYSSTNIVMFNQIILACFIVCKWLEMREHHWESIKSIESKKGKIKRALLQFTPESFNSTRWLDPECSWMRFVAIFQLVLAFQLVELNTFFVKHFFHLVC